MDCTALRGLSKVTPDQLNAYIACMEAPAAGNVQRTITHTEGIFFSILVVAVAVSLLIGATNMVLIRVLYAFGLIGIAGLVYSVFEL